MPSSPPTDAGSARARDPNAGIAARLAALTPEQRATLQSRLVSRAATPPASPSASPPTAGDRVAALELPPASFIQEAMWFLDQLSPGDPSYHRPIGWRFRGPLNPGALEAALNEVVRRHDALRTTFRAGADHPLQFVAPHRPFPLPVTEVPEGHAAAPEAWLAAKAREEADRPFDLAAGPLFRAHLLRLAVTDHALLLNFHHTVYDGWSATVFHDELATLYRAFREGRPSPLPPLPFQYADFAREQRRRMESPALRRQLAEAVQHLRSHPGVLELPVDHPRPAVRGSRGASSTRTLPAPLSHSIREWSRSEGVTLFMTMAAATGALLHRYTGDADILVGVPVAGRTRVDIEPLVGCFLGVIVLRLDFHDDPSVRTLLQRTRDETLQACSRQEIPFELLVAQLRQRRDPGRTPVFQVSLQLRNLPRPAAEWPDLQISAVPVATDAATTDLAFDVSDIDHELQIHCQYATDLFEAATIHRMLGHFERLLRAFVDDPERPVGRLPLLDPEEQRQLLVDWNNTAVDYPRDCCVHQLVAAQVRRTPDAAALIFENASLTYRELHDRAVALARHLRAAGVGPDVPVGLCLERSLDLVVAALGILHAGGAYLPLDPRHPAERLALFWRESHATILLTRTALRHLAPAEARVVVDLDALPPEPPSVPFDAGVAPHHLAYLLFTSGSTGVPKGVAVEHRAVVNFLHSMLGCPGLGPDDVVLGLTTLGFDIATLEIFLPLICGGRVVFASDATRLDPHAIGRLIEQHGINVVQATPATWRLLQAADWRGHPRLRALSGGEPLPADLADWILSRCAELWNLFGPTETTVYSVFARIHPTRAILIGRPIANTQLYVVDSRLQPVPVGVPGELLIGGDGLARGYLHRPDLTAERFLPDPFSSVPGARVYRTGDRVRYRPDGNLEHLGRLDHQIKIRGIRIEPEEIEFHLATHPALAHAAVTAPRTDTGETRLHAFVVAADPGRAPSAAELRAHLAARLPAHMVPGSFTLLAALPLTPTGKIDRKALAGLTAPELDSGSEFVAPRSDFERDVAGLWQVLLHRDRVGIHDNFFDLGGHSLLVVQLVARLRAALKHDVPLRVLFEHPTIASFVGRLQTSPMVANPTLPPIRPRTSERHHFPLSFAQQRLWFLHQLEGGSVAYHIPIASRLRGDLHLEALHRALRTIVDRHESLRTRFAELDGSPVQIVEPDVVLDLPLRDLSGLAPGDQSEALERFLVLETSRPFDLAVPPLLRVALVRLAPDDHILCRTFHHLVSDGWSTDMFHRELSALYAAYSGDRPSPLSALPVQYADFALWQRAWLQGHALRHQLDYWRVHITDAPLLNLPADRPRPASVSYAGAALDLEIPLAVAARLAGFRRAENVTPFMAFLTVFQVLVARHSGQTDFLLGTPIANRRHADLEPLVGFFANTLALRADLAGEPSFRQLLARVRTAALAAFDHQDLPFDRLVEELNPPRHPSRHPLFQVIFAIQNAPSHLLELPGIDVRSHRLLCTTTHVDLELHLWPDADTWAGRIQYSTALFDRATIERLASHFLTLLDSLLADPDRSVFRAELLTPAERQQLLVEWNPPHPGYPTNRCVHELFERQAALHPAAIALEFEDATLSYSELDHRANQLARFLRAQGVGPGQLVGLCAERSLETIVALVAILKAGGAYLPLDPQLPRQRLAFLLRDARSPLILVQRRFLDRITDPDSETAPEPSHRGPATLALEDVLERVASDDASSLPNVGDSRSLAYALYTSGTTGVPKGVLVPHLGIVRLVTHPGYVRIDEREVFLQFAPLSFDASTFEIWGALLHGARLVIAPPRPLDLPELGELLHRHRVSTLWLTASLFRQVVEETPSALDDVRQLLSGGDVLPPETVARYFQRPGRGRLINGYGPTENTTFTTCHPMDRAPAPDRSIPIGRPIPGTYVRILDPHGQLVPAGILGELHAGGDGLAHGYLNQPGLTAERFVPDPFPPFPGARLYRTGDLVRFLGDGCIEFLGRLDHQVKIRGFRVEPGEIEAILGTHPSVANAAVITPRSETGESQLRAFVVASHPATPPSAADLRAHLAARLPTYMVPASFTLLTALPLSPHGKIDRRALEVLDAPELPAGTGFIAPRSDLERAIAEIWRSLLRRESIGIRDTFFELGGHSLLAVQLVARLRSNLHREVPVRALFEHPTIEELARAIEPSAAATPAPSAPILRPPPPSSPLSPIPRRDSSRFLRTTPGHPLADTEAVPASFSQTRMWLVEQLEPGDTAYLIPRAIRIEGPLDLEALAGALSDLGARHEAFRTAFEPIEDRIDQIIHPHPAIILRVVDLTQVEAADRDAGLEEELRLEAALGFDLTRPPLARFTIFRLDPETHILLGVFHHLISDAWSLGIVDRELPALYAARREGADSPLPPLAIHYADFAIWQADQLARTPGPESLRQGLVGAPDFSSLSPDLTHSGPSSSEGRQIRAHLDGPEWLAFSSLCRQEEITPFMGLLALFALLLGRHTGRGDVVIGSPIAARDRIELEPVVGVFINVLPLRCQWSGGLSLRSHLRRIREVTLGAYAHQSFPFERLIEGLSLPRVGGRTPLIQVLLNVVPPRPEAAPAWPDLHIQPLALAADRSKFDLTLYAEPSPERLELRLNYRTCLFSHDRVREFLAQFLHLLRQAPAAILAPLDTLSLVRPESHGLLPEPTLELPVPELPAIADTLAALARAPDGLLPALHGSQATMSRAELDGAAGSLARRLRPLLSDDRRTVAIGGPRSPANIVAMLAVLRAGGILLPFDLTLPEARISFMLREARAAVLIWTGPSTDRPISAREEVRHILDLDPDTGRPCDPPGPAPTDLPARDLPARDLPARDFHSPAYLCFTSGTTGVPKAVLGTHHGLDHFIHWQRTTFDIGPDDRAAHLTGLSFDVVLRDVFTPLSAGATLCLPVEGQDNLPEQLLLWLARERITLLHAVPSLARAWLDAAPPDLRLPDLRLVFFAGEPLPESLVRRWRALAPSCRVINLYGPTETTLAKCFHEIVGDPLPGIQPVGSPLPQTQALVLSPARQLCGIGEPGEIVIRTPFRSLGYAHAPDATAARFIPNPWRHDPADLLYLTGDLGRFRPDGSLDILGRADSQVKIHGQRIELEEIVTVLSRHPAVHACSVHARESESHGKILVACVVPAESTRDPAPALAQFLRQRLPLAFVPSAFLFLDHLPLSPNGKTDQAALARLPLPSPPASDPTPAFPSSPRGRLEREVARIWSHFLPGRAFHSDSDFFESGGQSLLALQVLSRLHTKLGLVATLADFFRHPTVAGLAALAEPTPPTRHPRPRPRPRRFLGSPTGVPLFVVPGYFGLGALSPGLVEAIQDIAPYYDRLRYAGVDDEDTRPPDTTMGAIADHLISQIHELLPAGTGPLCLAGFSFGGTVAFEIARRLVARGEEVPLLILFDSRWPRSFRRRSMPAFLRELVSRVLRQPRGQRLGFLTRLVHAGFSEAGRRLRDTVTRRDSRPNLPLPGNVPAAVGRTGILKEAVRLASYQAYATYEPGAYPARVILFRATEIVSNEWIRHELPPCNGWSSLVTGPLEIIPVPRDHLGLVTDPLHPIVLDRTAALLREARDHHRHRPSSSAPRHRP